MSAGTPSLQRRLTIAVVAIVGVALGASSATVYVVSSRASRERFDERLADAGRAVAMAVAGHEDRAGELETASLGAVDQSRGTTAFQIWREDGSVLVRSPTYADSLPRPANGAAPRFDDVEFPGGGSGRLYRAWFQPIRDGPSAPAARRLAVAVLRDTRLVDGRLSRRRAILSASALGAVLLAAAAAWLAIRSSLREVARLSASIASIDASSLGRRLELRGLPDELRPPFVKLNELLSRIERSMARERQFSSDVSHELRTPLAGLRTILEVSSSRERAASEYRTALEEALQVVAQIEAIVEDLLALARLGAGQMAHEHREEVRLRDLVQSCFDPLGDAARGRGLTFENRIAPEANVHADELKLRLVAANLLSNATQYTADGGWIRVESDPPAGLVLRVRDSGPPIPYEAMTRIFDPFFRLDRSRSGGGEHCGVGLTLVRDLCDTLGYRVSVQNDPDGAVAFTVEVGPASSTAPGRSLTDAASSGS